MMCDKPTRTKNSNGNHGKTAPKDILRGGKSLNLDNAYARISFRQSTA